MKESQEKIFKLEDLPTQAQINIKSLCNDLEQYKRFSIGVGEAKERLENSMFVNSYRNIEVSHEQ